LGCDEDDIELQNNLSYDEGHIELQSNFLWTEHVAPILASKWFFAGWLTSVVAVVNAWCIRLGFQHAERRAQAYVQKAKQRWRDFYEAPFKWAAIPKNKITMVQINSIFQIINLIYRKEYKSISGHAINIGITSWDSITDFIALAKYKFSPAHDIQMSEYLIGDEVRFGSATDFRNDMFLYRAGQPLPPQNNVRLQSGFTDLFDKFIENTGTDKWNARAISEMNQKFLFVRNVSSITKSSIELFQAIVSIVSRTLFGIDPFDPEYTSFVVRIEKALDAIHRFSQMLPNERQTREQVKDIEAVYDEIELIRRDPYFQMIYTSKAKYFVDQCKKFESIYQNSKSLHGSRSERIEPTSIMFLGAPGSGKSASVNVISQVIVRNDFLNGLSSVPLLRPEQVYTANLEEDYWSGYFGQLITCFDDLFKTTDQKDRARQGAEVI
jgi:hypothetical protein